MTVRWKRCASPRAFKALAAILGALLCIARRRGFPVGSTVLCARRPLDRRTPKPHDTS